MRVDEDRERWRALIVDVSNVTPQRPMLGVMMCSVFNPTRRAIQHRSRARFGMRDVMRDEAIHLYFPQHFLACGCHEMLWEVKTDSVILVISSVKFGFL